jgi:hypothetical protein
MRRQFKQVQVGEFFSRPVFGIAVVYRKVSMETKSEAGTAEIVEAIGNPEMTGRVVTINRDHIVHTHETNPITDEHRRNAAEAKAAAKNNPRGLRHGPTQQRTPE